MMISLQSGNQQSINGQMITMTEGHTWHIL